eukprot:TRINITY_DN4504_c0_g1_i1.p1 TRINITY_DN4504_c0_g1~~TRINITY_DN4504_c0_g1_i1.p1  ORF type:complete len:468 (-),score=59.92 TRINITY_DN4504_c0_g1_i1:1340-2743(-)
MQNRLARIAAAFLCLISVVATTRAAVVVWSNSAPTPTLTVQAPDFACLTEKHVVSGPLEILTGRKGENNGDVSSNLEGKIIMVNASQASPRRVNGTSILPLLLMKDHGAVGILVVNAVTKVAGIGETLLPSWDLCYKLAPVMLFEITADDAAKLQELAQQNNSVFIEATPGDVNEWRQYRNGWYSYTFRFFFGILSGITAILALYKLIAYVVAYGCQLSVPQFCLFIAFVANLFRTIYHSLDPIFFGKVFPGTIAHLLVSISAPMNIITTMLLALYWKEILSSGKIKVVLFVSRMKIPFAIICVVAFGVEIASSVMRGVTVGGFGFMAVITGIIYIVIVSLMTIFFAIYGAKVLIQLHNSDAKSHVAGSESRRRKVARNATVMVLFSSAMNVVWVVGMILIVIPRVFYTPLGFHIVWVVVWLGVIGSQLSQILAFKTPSSKSHSSGTGTNSHTRPTASGGVHATDSL